MSHHKYRVWCETDNQWEITTGEPVETCPVDAAHDVRIGSLTVTDSTHISFEKEIEIEGLGKGVILNDQTDGKKYRVKTNNGAISSEEVIE
jgi:hypothetical protein